MFSSGVNVGGGGVAGGSGKLSAMRGATAANSIDNGNFQQTWLNTKLNLNTVSENPTGKLAIFLGDSFTEMPSLPANRFTTFVSSMLGCTESNFGVSGTQANNFTPANIPIYNATLHEYLFIEYGLNDRGAAKSSAQYVIDIQAIVSNATGKGWPVGRIVVLTAPGFYDSLDYTAYNAGLVTAQGTTGFILVDLTAPFRTPGIYTPYQYTPGSNNHPSVVGAQTIANIVYGALNSKVLITNQGFVNNLPTQLWQLNLKNPPYLGTKGNLLMVDANGKIGVSNQIPDGSIFQGSSYFGSILSSSLTAISAGFAAGDWVIKDGSKILSDGGFSYASINLVSGGSTYIDNRVPIGSIYLRTSNGVQGTIGHAVQITTVGDILIDPSAQIYCVNGGGQAGFQISDGSSQTIFYNNANGNGFFFKGWDGTGGVNTNATFLQLKYNGITAGLTLNLRAGSVTAGTAPLKFNTTGALLTAAEAGALELAADQLYITGTSAVRYQVQANIKTTFNTTTTGNNDYSAFPLCPSGQTQEITATIVWRNTTTGASAAQTIVGLFKNIAGTITQEGATTNLIAAYGNATLVAAAANVFVIAGSQIYVRMVGIAATNITWGISMKIVTNNT